MLKSSAPLTIGMVGRCLSKRLVEGKKLEAKCRELVLVAAPKDSRDYYSYPDTASGIVKRIAEMQKTVGLEAVLVDPYSRSGSAVTVTGWVALACMMSLVVVFFGGLIMLYRKYSGIDKPQTLHVKMGDA
jgi:golgi apparatus protein 1